MIGKLTEKIRSKSADFIRTFRDHGSRSSESSQFMFNGNSIFGPKDMVDSYSSQNQSEFVSILRDELAIASEITGKTGFAVVDIGANIGVYAIGYALAGAKSVVAFEPFPATFAYLEKNVKNSSSKNIFIHSFGLFSRTMTMPIGSPSAFKKYGLVDRFLKRADQKQLGCMSIYTNAKNATSALFERGDDCQQLVNLESVGLVKIDVEGAEPEVIAGLEQFLKRHRPVLKVELNPIALSAANSSLAECRKLFSTMGYTKFLVCNRDLPKRNWLSLDKIDELRGSKDIILVQN